MRQLAERMRAPNRLTRKPDTLLRAGLIASALVALALLVVARVTAPNPTNATTLIGRPAPTFSLIAAHGGTTLPTPTHFTGSSTRPTLLVFFNTLCVHCLSEISAASQAGAIASGGPLDVIFIDTPGENAQITGAYMARLQLNPPVLLDKSGKVARDYRVGYGPTLALVDARGVIRGVWVGETSTQTLATGIRQALGK